MLIKSCPYRIYTGLKEEIIIFNQATLALTEINIEHQKILELFNQPKEKNIVINILKKHKIINGQKMIDDLLKNNLLIKIDNNNLKEKSSLKSSPKIIAFRIVLTENCNLCCKKCFVSKNKKSQHTMKEDIIKQVIKFSLSFGTKYPINYHFFGGEPLLKFNLIKRAVSIIEEAKNKRLILQPTYTITTNLTYLTNEQINFLAKNNFKVGVSIDGPKEINDQFRFTKNGQGTYDIVRQNYYRLKEKFVNCYILMTPHQENINNLIQNICLILKDFPSKLIMINTPFDPQSLKWEINGKKYAKILMSLLRWVNDKKIEINCAITPIIQAIANGTKREMPCSIMGNEIMASISPIGEISFCSQNWEQKISKPLNELNQKIISIPIEKNKTCLKCPSLNICGGICPVYQQKSKNMFDKNKCSFMNSIISEIVKNYDLFEK